MYLVHIQVFSLALALSLHIKQRQMGHVPMDTTEACVLAVPGLFEKSTPSKIHPPPVANMRERRG